MSALTTAWDFVRNARLVRNALEYASLVPDYFASFPARSESPALFDAVHTFVLFIGIGRSGTTLVGSLLDAHPRMVIANQQCALKYLYPLPYSRERIFRLLVQNSVEAARSGRPGGGGYSYAVPGQWQGTSERIEVIGDKSRSAQSIAWITSRPELLEKLASTTRARIRLVHVIRNPYDTIARRSMRRGLSLEQISREYFALTAQLQEMIHRIESSVRPDIQRIPVYLEDLIADPEKQLARICEELGVAPGAAWLEACAGIIYRTPREARTQVDWPGGLHPAILRRAREFPHLQRYSLEGSSA
jgi:hypothetical protein